MAHVGFISLVCPLSSVVRFCTALDVDCRVEASWKVVSWLLPRIREGGSSQGQQRRGSVEIVSKETELGLRRRGPARRLMHERKGK